MPAVDFKYFHRPDKIEKSKKQKIRLKPKRSSFSMGRDLTNWIFVVKDKSVDPATVFTIKDGVIHISGNPFGYMRTKDTFSDYRLHVEWHWPSAATNSGVFVHGQEPDMIWLKCVECQLKAGNAGDFVCMNGSDMDQRTDKSSILCQQDDDLFREGNR